MPNRVEELEATVSELESTVRGLTEELVETKERLRAVETELGVDAADFVDDPDSTAPIQEADPTEVREATSEATSEPATEEPTEKADEEEEEETDSSELGDDIIVA